MTVKNSDSGNSIRCVIDPSHESWVLGGLMRELAISSRYIHNDVIALPPIRKLFKYLSIRLRLAREGSILFSSLTPLENYLYFPILAKNQEIKLWFTHKEGSFSKTELKCLLKVDQIYVHSSHEANRLKELGCRSVTVAIGAVDSRRFRKKSSIGEEIVWVGTPSARKQPEIFLNLVQDNPETQFRLLGYGWEQSIYWDTVNSLHNLRHVPIRGPLTSQDFDGCFAYLMTSEVEGGPMPLLETLAAGLAPLVTDCGFVKDVFDYCEISSRYILKGDVPLQDQLLNLRENWVNHADEARARTLQLDFLRLSNILTGVSF